MHGVSTVSAQRVNKVMGGMWMPSPLLMHIFALHRSVMRLPCHEPCRAGNQDVNISLSAFRLSWLPLELSAMQACSNKICEDWKHGIQL